MAYSMVTMRKELELAYFADLKPGAEKPNPFKWEQDDVKGTVAAGLKQQFPYGRADVGRAGHNFVNDLLEYCWLVYSKSLNAKGPQLIGRTGDLWVAEHLGRVGLDLDKKQTLWDPHTKGNIQVMDKWPPSSTTAGFSAAFIVAPISISCPHALSTICGTSARATTW